MKVAVVGLGLIGGSFYKASLAAGHEVVGLHHGDATGFETAELILVCLPPESIVPWIRAHCAQFARGAVVIDICGVKTPIIEEMATIPQEGWIFIGGHPMAGREVSGYENSLPTLFQGASMILTPATPLPSPSSLSLSHSPATPSGGPRSCAAATLLSRLQSYFASVGFHETVITTPEHHDEMIAFTSQLCHVIATAYARDPLVSDAIGYSAGSYANMTRIATQDAEIWSALYQSNRPALLKTLEGFIARLTEFRSALAANDAPTLRRFIAEGTRAKRREILDRQRGDEVG